MTRAIRLLLAIFAAVLLQTEIAGYIRFANVAPDFLIVFLVLLSTGYGSFGGFCAGSLMAMFYDSSVGYVLAINLVIYTFIGYLAPFLRVRMDTFFRRWKHKSLLVLGLIAFFLTLIREILYIGYLFLIGSEQSYITVIRMLICAGYTSILTVILKILADIWHYRRHHRLGDVI